ncbi:MAG TPA: phosphoglycerate mutase family protein [Gemmatimonadaceae bacterium]
MLSRSRLAATAISFLAVGAAGACASASAGEAPVIPDGRTETTVYLVRHGEKMSETDRDPDLSDKGRARAESLAVALRDSGVNMIITTDLKRTMQTAAPLAKLRHITPKVIPIGMSVQSHMNRVVDEIKSHEGATILVVGHNNTIGHIASKLAGGNIGDLCTDEYANLIIISMTKGRVAKILLESYGVPDPPSGSCPHLRDR